MTTTAAESIYNNAMQWAATQGIGLGGVAPTEIPGRGLGMVATRAIEEGEALVSVPSSIMLTIDCIPKTFIESFPERTSTHGILAAFLLHGDTILLAKWKCWTDSWPDLQSFKRCMPISWEKELDSNLVDRGKLETSHCLLPPAASGSWNSINNSTRTSSENIYQNILPKQKRRMHSAWQCVLQAFPGTDWDMFSYYWFIINTRSFYYVTPGEQEPEDWNDAVGLVPIADYFNHAGNEVGYQTDLRDITFRFTDMGDIQSCMATFDKESYTINATRRIEEGEEVYISYGSHPNDYLLVEYGFIPDHNPYDAIFLDDLVFEHFTEYELEELKMHDLYGNYKITQNGPCSRTQDVACMVCMRPKKWQEYALHRSNDTTRRKLMTDTINNWISMYLQVCTLRIRALQSTAANSPSVGLDEKNGPDNLKLWTLLKRWIQMRDICETTLNRPTEPIGGNNSRSM
ncbi:hypothetical protein ASPVEDRAFT_251273 [Aspergillus versicolor CBS 583.65]|uniref:SET domain-containing protein n=1 Tax=Aspergillus versicolor CBS 583.65 TaxID=1036611 RepID=A0A1L9P5B3_ASPVE|nr:uncharacterized protein ASPVEDRAFT_251273 [Aspergillus versicolor CBS 583.65]OJI96721.1 hypothetical protein ASPVEDRAFT_251273 [Aspergillus versicolor CBS 583.65]